jgi:malonate-semialdehyde dehydrogenase (acetylating)/methylmalonate-semialdehyde dehydrogenase
MVPLWMYPVALACGNTFVLKPSEKVPMTAILIARLLEQAGVPPGVLNIVHGGHECVDALLKHPQVRAVSFVGSTRVARYIFETGTRHGKRVQANGSAKNFVIIMPDANIDQSTRSVIEGAFGCAGERCMASSTAVVVGKARKDVLPSLAHAANSIRVGPTIASRSLTWDHSSLGNTVIAWPNLLELGRQKARRFLLMGAVSS